MDRVAYKQKFSDRHTPEWHCPACKRGQLALQPKSLIFQETLESLAEQNYEGWEPEWVSYVFSCMFVCSNAGCQEHVACSGRGNLERADYQDEDGWHEETTAYFTPLYFQPSLILMDIPDNCALDVSKHLHQSFELFFASPAAALNCARGAIEALLTDLGVPTIEKNKSGGDKRINLHQRIELLPTAQQDVKDILLATKWLGNAGSHDGEAPVIDDVLDAYSLLEHALSEIYINKRGALKALAKRVNSLKGPLVR